MGNKHKGGTMDREMKRVLKRAEQRGYEVFYTKKHLALRRPDGTNLILGVSKLSQTGGRNGKNARAALKREGLLDD